MAGPQATSVIDLVNVAEANMKRRGLYVYDSAALTKNARRLLDLEMPYGLTVRFAVKANPFPGVVKLFGRLGLQFDAGSVEEARYLLSQKVGVRGSDISLSAQTYPDDQMLDQVIKSGVKIVSTADRHVAMFARKGILQQGIRVNPGFGKGGDGHTTVGGQDSSFGIWHEQLPAVLATAKREGVTFDRLHTHLGSGAESSIKDWHRTMQANIKLLDMLPDVTTLDMGGGFKVARMPEEAGSETDIEAVAQMASEELRAFAKRTGRRIHLEIEPGTFLVANAGVLLARVMEVKDTDRRHFIILNVGMNGLLRPSHYGAQHPIEILNDSREYVWTAVQGDACESGDSLTPKKGDPDKIEPRLLKRARVGDYVKIGGAGAYGLTMSALKYLQMEPPAEILV